MADVGVALVLLIAFSLVAAQGARELVRERLSEEKRILYLAGVHPVTYWTTALIWDFLVSQSVVTRYAQRDIIHKREHVYIYTGWALLVLNP